MTTLRPRFVFSSFLALELFFWILSGTHGCSQRSLLVPEASSLLWYEEGRFAVFQCEPGHEYQSDSQGIVWCDLQTQEWIGQAGDCIREQDPCVPNPCYNNGMCRSNVHEDPYGWGYYCSCFGNTGGRRCEIVNPCSTYPCPTGTGRCLVSWSAVKGRYCYSYSWTILD